MIAQIRTDDGIQQINTDLLVNKVSQEEFAGIVNAVQNDEPLSPSQQATLVQANILTPVAQIDVSLPNLYSTPYTEPITQQVVESEAVVDEQPVAKAPVKKKKKKKGILDKVTNYIYSLIFK